MGGTVEKESRQMGRAGLVLINDRLQSPIEQSFIVRFKGFKINSLRKCFSRKRCRGPQQRQWLSLIEQAVGLHRAPVDRQGYTPPPPPDIIRIQQGTIFCLFPLPLSLPPALHPVSEVSEIVCNPPCSCPHLWPLAKASRVMLKILELRSTRSIFQRSTH